LSGNFRFQLPGELKATFGQGTAIYYNALFYEDTYKLYGAGNASFYLFHIFTLPIPFYSTSNGNKNII